MRRFVMILCVAATLAGCSRKTTTVVSMVHDTVFVNKTNTELVYSHDTTYVDRWHYEKVEIKGDTVHHWHRDSSAYNHMAVSHDTIRSTDTVYLHDVVTASSTTAEPKHMRWWLLLVAALAGIIAYIILERKFS